MKTLTINNPKIVTYLQDKDTLVKQGRKISEKIEKIEAKIAKNDARQREITTKVEPTELIKAGKALQEDINQKLTDLDFIGDQIMQAKLAAIPEEVKKEYFILKKEKEELEEDRNKIALKVQKIKDRVVPIIKKEVKPLLGEYEDIETAQVARGQVKIEVFSYLEQWKAAFAKKK
jgi:predicted  nucleic acid-binding Zn-ribbon protein